MCQYDITDKVLGSTQLEGDGPEYSGKGVFEVDLNLSFVIAEV